MTNEITQIDINKLPDFIFEIEKKDKDGNTVNIRQFNRIKLADAMHKAFHTIYFNETLYIYDKEKHYYRKAANEIETTIRDFLKSFDVLTPSLTGLINEIRTHLKSMKAFSENPFDNSNDKIPVKNGIIQIDYEKGTVRLLNHGPEHLFTYYINADFDEKIGKEPALKILQQWVSKKDIDVLIQAPAQALYQKMHHVTLKKSYLFIGETDSAKSTFLDMIAAFIGEQFLAGASLHDLCNRDFITGALDGKLIDIYHELPTRALENVEQFKTLTGSIYNEIHHKGIDGYDGQIICTFMFSCNRPPLVNTRVLNDVAFWNRWIIAPFPNSFESDPSWVEKNLTPEFYTSFLNCVIQFILKIRTDRKLPVTMSIEDTIFEWTTKTNSVGMFVNSSLFGHQPSGGSRIFYDKDEIFKLYTEWCMKQRTIKQEEIVPDLPTFCKRIHSFGFTPTRTVIYSPTGPGETEKTEKERKTCLVSWFIPIDKEIQKRILLSKEQTFDLMAVVA